MLEQLEMRAVSVTGLAEWEWVGRGGGGSQLAWDVVTVVVVVVASDGSERLKHTVLLFGGMSWWLNVLSICHSSSSSGWEGLFRTVFIVSILLLSAAASKLCSSSQTTELDILSKFTGIASLDAASPTHYSQEQCIGHW